MSDSEYIRPVTSIDVPSCLLYMLRYAINDTFFITSPQDS